MPNPKNYKLNEKSKFMRDCLHQTLHVEKKKKNQGIAICLNLWRNKAKKVALNYLSILSESSLKPNIKTTGQKKQSNYIQDHINCPVCGERAKTTCRCKIGDKTCPNKHSWHTCSVHNKVFIGKKSHIERCLKWGSNCTCPSNQNQGKASGCSAVMEDWPEKENIEYSPELPQVPLEATTALAVRALINEHPISSGWHSGFNPNFNQLNPCWAIVFKGTLSKTAIRAAQKAGLKINKRKNIDIIDIYLPNIMDSIKARSIFNDFAEIYKQDIQKVSSILYKYINQLP